METKAVSQAQDLRASDASFAILSPGLTTGLLMVSGLGILLLSVIAVRLVTETDLNGYISTMLLHGGLYLLAAIVVLHSKPILLAKPTSQGLFWLVIGFAIVMRLIAMTAPANLTTDAYRYVWDGRLLMEGINPYLFVPADPQLSHLRDDAIFPNINKRDIAHTIYPPMAQVLFAAGVWISDSLAGQKAVMFASELVIIACLAAWLSSSGLPRAMVLLYAWHPLPIWEFSSQAHLDAGVAAFMAAAILAVTLRRQGLAGALLAGGVLIKYYPLILIPALWRRWDWRMPVCFFAVIFLAYLPFVQGAGLSVFGFLGSHLGNEGYRDGWGFHIIWFLRDFGLVPMDDPDVTTSVTLAYLAVALTVLAGLALVAFFNRKRDEFQPEMMALIGAAFVFFTSPHYPWYAAFLVMFLVRVPHPALFAMTLFAVVLQLPRPPGGPTWTHVYALAYWLPLLMFLGQAVFVRWRRRLR
ncbi:MAG: glycosyltransferase 87 family protein [Pseudomonadota bacterium]